MLISNETPKLTWSFTDDPSSWINGAPFSELTNGAPRAGVKFSRAIAGPAGFQIEAVWPAASKPTLFALLGLGEEFEGRTVSLTGRNSVSGNYDITIDIGIPVVRLPDGSLAALYVIDPEFLFQPINGIRIGVLFAEESATIGEVVIATAERWCIRRDWVETVVKLTKENLTVSAQPYNVRRVQYRKASVTIAPQQWSKSVSLSGVQTLQKLQARLSQNQPVLVIPALSPPGSGKNAPIDTDTAFASALFGWCDNVGQIGLVQESNLAELKLSFTEAPAGRVN